MRNTCYISLHSYLILTRTLGGDVFLVEERGWEKPRSAWKKASLLQPPSKRGMVLKLVSGQFRG